MNSGTFTKSTTSGTTTLAVPFTNTNGGVVDVQTGILSVGVSSLLPYKQTAGITILRGTQLTSSTNIDIQGGTLAGSG